jgi:hypothetical protein
MDAARNDREDERGDRSKEEDLRDKHAQASEEQNEQE